MIYLTMRGRLGNQLFQYAFARAIKEKTNKDIIINWSEVDRAAKYSKSPGFENSLKYFKTADFDSVHSIDYRKAMNIFQYLDYREYQKNIYKYNDVISQDIYQRKFLDKHHKGLFYLKNGYYDFKIKKFPKNIFLDGHFESKKYFDEIRDILLKEFTPIHSPLEHNKKLYEQVNNSESICVTIRRGDFLNLPFHNVCGIDYYLKGMDIIKERIPNAEFFIFSDDVEWLKENVDFKYPVTFEKGNDPVWEKLRLMYSCKHFVIANSTFSWWAQYLSRNEKKIVIAPERWYNSEMKSELLNDDSFLKITC